MTQEEILERILSDAGGYLSCKEASARGISPQVAIGFAHRRGLVRAARGLYHDPLEWEDPLHVLQHRYAGLIFSHEVALFLHGQSEREPAVITITLATGSGTATLAREGIKVYKVQQRLLEVGLEEARTMHGHPVRCYNPERTLVDLNRSRSHVDRQELLSALTSYARSPGRNIPLLMRYAKLFSVERILVSWLEVLA